MVQHVIGGRDKREFEAFVAASSDRLLRTAYLLTGDLGHAEDVVQTALLRTARRWRSAREAPEAYARTVVANLAKDRWRALGRRPAEAPLEHDVPLDRPGRAARPRRARARRTRAAAGPAGGARAAVLRRPVGRGDRADARRLAPAPSSHRPRARWPGSGPRSPPRTPSRRGRTPMLTDDDLIRELGAAFRDDTAGLRYAGKVPGAAHPGGPVDRRPHRRRDRRRGGAAAARRRPRGAVRRTAAHPVDLRAGRAVRRCARTVRARARRRAGAGHRDDRAGRDVVPLQPPRRDPEPGDEPLPGRAAAGRRHRGRPHRQPRRRLGGPGPGSAPSRSIGEAGLFVQTKSEGIGEYGFFTGEGVTAEDWERMIRTGSN